MTAVHHIGAHMHEHTDAESLRPQRDRAYTIARIEWMLENYHALLSPHIDQSDEEREVGTGHTTQHAQWWKAQAYWRRVDRKADLDKQIDAFWYNGDHRAWLLLDFRFRRDPCDRPTWEEVAAALGITRMHVYRIYPRIIREIAWQLGGIRDE